MKRREERQTRIEERWKESDRGVILQIYYPLVIDVSMLKNADGAAGSSVFTVLCFRFFSPSLL